MGFGSAARRRTFRLLVAAAVAVVLLVGTAGPASARVFRMTKVNMAATHAGSLLGTVPIRHSGVCGRANRPPRRGGPISITSGPDGDLWFAGSCIGRMTTTGQVTNVYRTTHFVNSITPGPDGALWFTTDPSYSSGDVSTGAAIGRITVPGAPRPGTHRPVPSSITIYHLSTGSPGNITVGPDGALWFTMGLPPAIGRISTSGAITEYPVKNGLTPTPGTITAGPDGALWYTTIEFPTTTGPAQASVSRMTTSGVVTATYTTSFPAGADDIVTGPDGALWFTSNTGYCPIKVANGCYLVTYPSIVRMTTGGSFTEYGVPEPLGTGPTGPQDITTGPDGALWFTSYGPQGAVGRITTSGVMTNCTSSALKTPAGITAGPDGAIWFTNYLAHTIGRVPDPAAFAC
jgi:virginiamycin B lyase